MSPSIDFLARREAINDEIADHINNRPTAATVGQSEAQPQGKNMNVTSKIITITPEDATAYLAKMVHNRPVSMANVKAYAQEITLGRWGITGQGVIFDPDGRLLDGQHRMHAIVRAGKAIQTLAVYGVPHSMFSRMDVGNKRTVSDVIEVKNRVMVAAACKYLFRESRGHDWWNTNHRPRPMDGVAIVAKYRGIEASATAVKGHRGIERLMLGSLAAYCHFRAGMDDLERRDAFFKSFSSGADLGIHSPILALRNALVVPQGTRINDNHQIALFICAWYRFLDKGQAKFIRLPKEMPRWRTKL